MDSLCISLLVKRNDPRFLKLVRTLIIYLLKTWRLYSVSFVDDSLQDKINARFDSDIDRINTKTQ